MIGLLFSFQTYTLLGVTAQTMSSLRRRVGRKKKMAARNLGEKDIVRPFFVTFVLRHL